MLFRVRHLKIPLNNGRANGNESSPGIGNVAHRATLQGWIIGASAGKARHLLFDEGEEEGLQGIVAVALGSIDWRNCGR